MSISLLKIPLSLAQKEPVALAVRSFQDATINQGDPLLVSRNAVSLFPRKNGVIVVNGNPYFYDNRIDNEDPNYAKLTNIQSDTTKIPSAFPLTVTAASTYVILSPEIYVITSEGKSGNVTYTEEWHNQYGGSIYDRQDALTLSPESRKPDIEFEQEDLLDNKVGGPTSTGYITANNFDKSVVVTGSSGFGALWFQDTRPIGGIKDYCLSGGCLFKRGFRAFFILNHSGGDGDGLTFSVINRGLNDAGSVGGDVQLSELLAYAGDSRTVASPTGPGEFLDGKGEGLEAPKMALEFDGKANNQKFSICADSSTANVGTRNDPDFSGTDRDAVQYAFWGSENPIAAPCRVNPLTGTNKTYDDNRHDGVNEVWVFNSNGARVSSPAISSDGTAIYIGRSSNNTQTDAGRLIKIRQSDGVAIWSENPRPGLFQATMTTLNPPQPFQRPDTSISAAIPTSPGWIRVWLPSSIPAEPGLRKPT